MLKRQNLKHPPMVCLDLPAECMGVIAAPLHILRLCPRYLLDVVVSPCWPLCVQPQGHPLPPKKKQETVGIQRMRYSIARPPLRTLTYIANDARQRSTSSMSHGMRIPRLSRITPRERMLDGGHIHADLPGGPRRAMRHACTLGMRC